MGDLHNDLEEKIVKVANQFHTTKIKELGGGGSFGHFYAVYRINFPTKLQAEVFMTYAKNLKTTDHGGHYYYGSAKVTIPSQEVKVTAVSLSEELA
jgi:hypothetical protein